jgi:hypothetical protein
VSENKANRWSEKGRDEGAWQLEAESGANRRSLAGF